MNALGPLCSPRIRLFFSYAAFAPRAADRVLIGASNGSANSTTTYFARGRFQPGVVGGCCATASDVPPARAKRALLQPEPSPLHIGAEILALRHGIVTGLVLAPTVLFRLAEAVDIALSAVGEDTIAPLVVGAHLLVRRIGVAVAMHREAERQPRRDKRRSGRYADAETRHREHIVRQTQEPAHFLGVIADHADRAATEARRLCRRDEGFERDGRIDRRVEEGVEMVVGEGMTPPRVHLP